MKKMIPLSVPNFEGKEEEYVLKAVKEGWVSTGGAAINELEKRLTEFTGAPAVAACQSGTAALHLSLVEAGVEPDMHVIVPTLTFIAAVNPVKYQFAEPIFMDCDDSLCMDAQKLRSFCEEECELLENGLHYKRTGRLIKAIVVVHIFGNLADMEAIMDIAKEYRLQVIEDATEALGSYFTAGRYKGCMAGTVGDFGAYSFNGNKIITTGGGGAVTAGDEKKLAHMKYLSTQSKDDGLYYIHNEIGYNYRMTNLQAALGVAQMESLPEFIRRKNKNYEIYRSNLEGLEAGGLLPFREDIYSNKWFYSLVLDKSKVKKPIREIIEALSEQGIQTRPIWGLIHEQLPYRDCPAYKIEKAAYYSERIINLPCSTNITEEEIRYVCDTVKELLG